MANAGHLDEVRRLTMCFDTDALPPDPARTGMGAGSERTVLASADGNRFAATVARTQEAASAGIVVIPDVRGLYRYYERLAEHLADAGIHAVALDPYGRTAGRSGATMTSTTGPHRAAASDDGDPSRRPRRRGPAAGRGSDTVVISMGFCFGGRASLMQASQESIDGAIAFYGPPAQSEEGGLSPLEEAEDGLVRVPVLGLYGGADRGIPMTDVEAYEPPSTPPGSSIGSSCSRRRRTRSSTGPCANTRRRVGTRGRASWGSSTASQR